MSDEPEGWAIKVTRATVKLWWLHFFVIGINLAIVSWILVVVIGLATAVEQGRDVWDQKEAKLDALIQKLVSIEEAHPWTPRN